MNRLLRYMGEFAEELILLGIIVLNVLEFFELLSPDWNYIEKLLSITALCYLLYKVSLTKIIFGTENKHLDFALLFAYLMLSFKNIISYSQTAMTELMEKGTGYWADLIPVRTTDSQMVIQVTSPLSNVSLDLVTDVPVGSSLDGLARSFTIVPDIPPHVNEVYLNVSNDVSSRLFLLEPKFLIHRWHNLLLDHGSLLMKIGIVAGLILLLCIAWIYTRRMAITKPSMMHVIQEEGPPPSTLGGSLVRFLIVFATLNFFFIAVFNLTMEWLALAVDAPLIVMAVFFYLLIWLKHHKRFDPESLIYRIGNFGDEFFQSFVELFHSSRGILIALSGMLVLHMLTDIGNFFIPYVTGLANPLYLSPLVAGHTPVFAWSDLFSGAAQSLIMQDVARSLSTIEMLCTLILYAANCLAFLMVFSAPAFLWYVMFKNKEIAIPDSVLAVFFAVLTVSLMAPVFQMQRIDSHSLVGVDITTQPLAQATAMPYLLITVIGLVVLLGVRVLAAIGTIRPKLILIGTLAVLLAFAVYIYYFFIDTGSYYVSTIVASLRGGEIIIGVYFIMFLTLTIVFYVGGWVIYIYELLTN